MTKDLCGSVANPPPPATVFAPAANILTKSIVPTAAANPVTVTRAHVAARAIVVAVAGIVPRSVIGSGNAQPKQSSNRDAGGNATAVAGLGGCRGRDCGAPDECHRQCSLDDFRPHGRLSTVPKNYWSAHECGEKPNSSLREAERQGAKGGSNRSNGIAAKLKVLKVTV